MSTFKELLLAAGFEDVDSYINSGNLFFSSNFAYKSYLSKVEELLEDNFNFSIPFALITKEDYLKEKANLPDW